MENYSLADLKAVTDGSNGFGGNGAWWLILLFLFIGNGGWNRNNGDYGQYATAASQQEILFGQKFANLTQQATANYQALDNKVDRIGNGIADATYALTNNIHSAQDVVAGAVTTEGRNLQMQLAECCCGNKEATAQVRYDMANFAAQINSNIDNKFAALEKAGLEQTIAAQNARINQLELNSALCGVVRYPMGFTYAAQNPFCGCNQQQVVSGCCGCNA